MSNVKATLITILKERTGMSSMTAAEMATDILDEFTTSNISVATYHLDGVSVTISRTVAGKELLVNRHG